MEEVWKDIKGYEGKYAVSNLGNVKSLHFYGKNCGTKDNGPRNLKPILKSNGYFVVSISQRQVHVHRLVAEAFIDNPDNKPCIDHINTITTDNRVSNLRWCTPKENLLNPISHKRRLESVKRVSKGKFGIESHKHRSIYQYSLDGKFIREWGCISDACRELKIDTGGVTKAAQGLQAHCGGFIWRYNKVINVLPIKLREKAILQYTLEGEFIKAWPNITSAAKSYNTTTGRICSCLKGITRKCRGYIWRYEDDILEEKNRQQ